MKASQNAGCARASISLCCARNCIRLSWPLEVQPTGPIDALRPDAIAAHEQARLRAWWERPTRKPAAEPCAFFPGTQLTCLSNVYNERSSTWRG